MRRGWKTAVRFLALTMAEVAWAGESVGFAARPVVERRDGRSIVKFAVSAPTDVEVAVLNASNRVVRHLAAGVLGGTNAPPEPMKPGLSQELVWDGKDDVGKPATGAPYKFRVRVGMRAELDGFLAEKRYWIGDLSGLAVGPGGDLYVYSSIVFAHRGHSRCLQVFSRDGQYRRTIMPAPANLAREKLLPFNTADRVTLDVPGEHFVPRNYFGTWPEFYPGPMGQLCPRLTAERNLVLAYHSAFARLDTDGGAVEGTFWQPLWKANPSHYTASVGFSVVPSPDGRFFYLSGFRSAKQEGGADTDRFPPGRVYRMSSMPGSVMEKFVDIPGDKASFHGNTINGADCDQDGNLLVCDWGGNKIRVFSPEGKELDGFAVDGPEYVACHRKTGAVYVLCAAPAGKSAVTRKLVKFSSWKADAKKMAEMDIPFRDTYIYYLNFAPVC